MISFRKMLPREIDAAKQHLNSRARAEIASNAMQALCYLRLVELGDLEEEHGFHTKLAKRALLDYLEVTTDGDDGS